ncbi:MAG: exodeoxyribonuclease VII large subunit [Elusimicrobia bacterium]|nr:exodeoxyribonuclease VII large subunit [Elusimicrobiota bacterium]
MQQERYVFKVSELNNLLKERLEAEFPDIWLAGEISNYRPNASGHLYFTLKDESGQIGAVMFRFAAAVLKFKVEDGLKVIIRGKVSIYVPGGKYQIIISQMEPAGIGALALAFEQLKVKLKQEGLFDPAHKKPIPVLPQKIGIVTSLTGAAIHDMLKILTDRYSNLEILIYPVQVQGDDAKNQIAQAIDDLNQQYSELDVIIVGRGGGSSEDLGAFNEEIVARAIYASRLPVISAVGHEYDVTIADFVADLRAATPSNAAELVVKEKKTLVERVQNAQDKLITYFTHVVDNYRLRVEYAITSSVLTRPLERLEERQQQVDELLERIAQKASHLFEVYWNKFKEMENMLRVQFERYFETKKTKLFYLAGQLNAFSPLGVLERGYSIVYVADKKIVNSGEQIKIKDIVSIQLWQGRIEAEVKKIEEGSNVNSFKKGAR